MSGVPGRRVLVVNADDFGRSPGINEGILKSSRDGIVTSASLMVRWPAAAEAVRRARSEVPRLGLGLHVDLTEWRFAEDGWERVYEVVSTEDEDAIRAEIRRQLDTFRSLVGADPTHLDSHQHVHRHVPRVGDVLRSFGDELGVPVREQNGRIVHNGSFHGQTMKGEPLHGGISVDALVATIRALPAGITELSCHPGLGRDFDSSYYEEREREVETLCDPRVRATIESEMIGLRSFAEI